jgi:hypothetical protein
MRLRHERLGDLPELADGSRDSDQDEPTRNRDRARNDQRIAQAEGIDRNTESDRDEAGGGGQKAYDQQNDCHRISVPHQPPGSGHNG